MFSFFQVRSFLTWWLDAVDGHSLHSPFLFDFYNEVIVNSRTPNGMESVEQLRSDLRHRDDSITVQDFGSGPSALRADDRTVGGIARTSLSSRRYSCIYRHIIEHYRCKHILELGTSLGVNTLYLASSPDVTVTTFEGSEAIARLATSNFERLNRRNIHVITGDITDTLKPYLVQNPPVDFVFMDANHRYEPTISYYDQLRPHLHERSFVVIDDIHYRPGMQRAWDELRRREEVRVSIDLFRAGILVFDPSLNKQHVVIQV